jgi:hypothetical protein
MMKENCPQGGNEVQAEANSVASQLVRFRTWTIRKEIHKFGHTLLVQE